MCAEKTSSTKETPKQVAESLFIKCYPNWYDKGQFIKKSIAKEYAKKIVNTIIKEISDNYNKNHIRLLFWKQVLIEIDAI